MRKALIAPTIIAALVVASTVAATELPANGTEAGHHLTVFEHQTEFIPIDNAPAGPSVGDSFALSSDLYTDSTQLDRVGEAGVACTQTSVTRGPAGEVECSFTVALHDGQITATGLVDLASATTPNGRFTMPVVGGTSRYRNAKGEVTVAVINDTDSWDTYTLN